MKRIFKNIYNAKWFLTILFMVPLIPIYLHAEIYKTVDEHGNVIFTDKPVQNSEVIEVEVNTVSRPSLVSQNQIIMYSTESCGVCKRAKAYMVSQGMKFKEYDIEESKSARRKFKSLGGKGVPLIVVGDQKMSGFSESRLNAMVAKAEQ